MERVLGIGGCFLRAADPPALTAWYRECLGLDTDEYGQWNEETGPTVFATFESGTDYFGARTQQTMLNFRVRDRRRTCGKTAATSSAGRTGQPIDARRDWLAWKALLQSARLWDARLHDARHTAAPLLLQHGVPARVATQVLGHSQISLILGTYSHVVPELAQEAADRMGDESGGLAAVTGTQSGTQGVPRWLRSGASVLVEAEPPVGIEPTTFSLRVRCSTD
ncbi:MAG: hypothetical protein QOJ68_3182 [Blastococcus sp.]|nr:hypothetical protein [Blastococcus sp.]